MFVTDVGWNLLLYAGSGCEPLSTMMAKGRGTPKGKGRSKAKGRKAAKAADAPNPLVGFVSGDILSPASIKVCPFSLSAAAAQSHRGEMLPLRRYVTPFLRTGHLNLLVSFSLNIILG